MIGYRETLVLPEGVWGVENESWSLDPRRTSLLIHSWLDSPPDWTPYTSTPVCREVSFEGKHSLEPVYGKKEPSLYTYWQLENGKIVCLFIKDEDTHLPHFYPLPHQSSNTTNTDSFSFKDKITDHSSVYLRHIPKRRWVIKKLM